MTDTTSAAEKDERPEVWVGHAVVTASDPARSGAWWESTGMRTVHRGEGVCILELRGGTHLVVTAGEVTPGDEAPFDLMVDDIDATHTRYSEAGFEPGPVERGDIHDRFVIHDPDGRVVTVNSSHVIGPV